MAHLLLFANQARTVAEAFQPLVDRLEGFEHVGLSDFRKALVAAGVLIVAPRAPALTC
jgi:hypothetical protein